MGCGTNAKDEFPEIEHSVRIAGGDKILVRKGDIKFQQENSVWADSALFKVFDFKLLKGDANTALKDPLSIVLSETTAKKFSACMDKWLAGLHWKSAQFNHAPK